MSDTPNDDNDSNDADQPEVDGEMDAEVDGEVNTEVDGEVDGEVLPDVDGASEVEAPKVASLRRESSDPSQTTPPEVPSLRRDPAPSDGDTSPPTSGDGATLAIPVMEPTGLNPEVAPGNPEMTISPEGR